MIWTSEERRIWLSEEATGTKTLLGSEIGSCLGSISFASYGRRTSGVVVPKWRVFGKYALVYLIDGGGMYRDALGHKEILKPGDLIFVFPEIGHVYGPRKGDIWTEVNIIFSGAVFDSLREADILNSRAPVTQIGARDEWLDRFERLLSYGNSKNRTDRIIIVSKLIELIAEVANYKPQDTAIEEEPWLRQAKSLIEATLDRPFVLGEAALSAGLSYDSFRKSFQRSVGIPPGQYHAIKRIAAACSLLRFTQMSVAQIAANLGFSDEYHFSKRFQAIKGIRPAAYRKGLRFE